MASLGSCLRPSHVHLTRTAPSLQKLLASSTSLSLSQGSPLQASPSPFCISRAVSSSMSSSAIGFRKQRDVIAHSNEGIVEEKTSYVEKPSRASSKSLGDNNHPWEEWVLLLQKVQEQGYQRPVSDNGRISVPGEGPYDSYSELKHALLNFARDRDDMFVELPKEHLQVIAAAGCPDIERKSVNSAKRLRVHAQIDEAPVCTPCGFRKSCPRAFGAASGSHIPSTQEVVRLILAYAMRVKNPEAEAVTSAVQDACRAILSTLLEFSNKPRDPSLPRAALPIDLPKKPRSDDYESRRDSYGSGGLQRRSWEDRRPSSGGARSAYEALPGDWRCPGCNFNNFARNAECRSCGGDRPAGIKGRERGSYGGNRQTQGYKEQGSQGREWSPRDREGGFQSRGERDDRGGPARRGGEEWDRRPSRDSPGRDEREPMDNERRWGLRSSEREPERRESNPYPARRQPSPGRDRRDSFRDRDDDFEEEEEWKRRAVQSNDDGFDRKPPQVAGRGVGRGGGGGSWSDSSNRSRYSSEREDEGRRSFSGFRGQSSRGRTETGRGGYSVDRSQRRSDDSSGYGESSRFSREGTPRGRSSRGASRGGPRNMGSRSYSTSSWSNEKGPEETKKGPTRDFWDDYAEGV